MGDAATQVVLTFDDNRLASLLFGQYGQNLALIERRLGVVAEQRGNHVTIEGSRDGCEQARRVLDGLYERLKRGDELVSGDVEGAIRLAIAQGSLFDYDPATARPSFEEINLRKRPVRARTAAQDAYIRALRRHALVFGTGPAGTGKTWLAVAHAVQLFERKEVDRIILSRPAVEAGERLGFLPGDMREKVDPYLRPIYDALYDLMDARIVERAMQTGEIEIAPLAFMRGRTLSNAVVILDEAQNTTSMQMKMFLTRLGENSRMIVTGDPSQVDLPHGQISGLAEAIRLLKDVQGIGQVTFSAEDVIRHELVERIVQAYDTRRARAETRTARAQGVDDGRSAGGTPKASWRSTSSSIRRCGKRSAARDGGAPGDCAAARRWRTHGGEVAVVLTDDAAIRVLNRDLARQGRPTNVLSFPATAAQRGGTAAPARRHRDRLRDHRARGGGRGQAARATTSPISRCMDFCICSATITSRGRGRRAWNGSKRAILARLDVPNPYVARDARR